MWRGGGRGGSTSCLGRGRERRGGGGEPRARPSSTTPLTRPTPRHRTPKTPSSKPPHARRTARTALRREKRVCFALHSRGRGGGGALTAAARRPEPADGKNHPTRGENVLWEAQERPHEGGAPEGGRKKWLSTAAAVCRLSQRDDAALAAPVASFTSPSDGATMRVTRTRDSDPPNKGEAGSSSTSSASTQAPAT